MLHMLRTVIGSRNFRHLLQEFYAAGGGVTAPRLHSLAEQIHDNDLSWFFAAWVEGTEVPSFVVRYQQHATASAATPFELRAPIAQLDADIRHPVMARRAPEGAPQTMRRCLQVCAYSSLCIPSYAEGQSMASITIRNLDDELKTRLRVRAAERGRSMEEEVRLILREAVSGGKAGPRDLAAFTRECFAHLGGIELELPPRGPMREPPDFA